MVWDALFIHVQSALQGPSVLNIFPGKVPFLFDFKSQLTVRFSDCPCLQLEYALNIITLYYTYLQRHTNIKCVIAQTNFLHMAWSRTICFEISISKFSSYRLCWRFCDVTMAFPFPLFPWQNALEQQKSIFGEYFLQLKRQVSCLLSNNHKKVCLW